MREYPTRKTRIAIKVCMTLLAITSALHCPGQTMAEIKSLLSQRNPAAFKAFIDSCQSNSGHSNVIARWEYLRDIMPGFQEGIVYIEESAPFNDGTGGNEIKSYRINLLSSGSTIFYYTFHLTGHQNDDDQSKIDSFVDNKLYFEFESVFRQTYNADLLKKDLFQTIVYGSDCGIAATPTEYQVLLNSFLKDRDVKSIDAWLKSANTEKQLYALKGLNLLKNTGYTPTIEESKLQALIRRKKGTVSTCSGCIFSSDSLEHVLSEVDSFIHPEQIAVKKPDKSSKTIYYALAGIITTLLISFIYFRRRSMKNIR